MSIVKKVQSHIETARGRLAALKADTAEPTFDNTILALELLDEELDRELGVFYARLGTDSNDEMQAAAEEIGPLTAAFGNDITLDPEIFKRIDDLWARREGLNLSVEQATILENSWTSMVRNGAKLDEAGKAKLREIDAELSKCGPKFSDNARKSAKLYQLHITDEADLDGLPDSARAAAQQAAEAEDKAGWLFTLDFPSYLPFMTYATNRTLREEMWRAFSSRGLGGEFDNTQLIRQILKLRHDRAQLLGYDSHADFVLERRMAKSKDRVMGFIHDLAKAARPFAEQDLEDLTALAGHALKPWDIAFYSEQLKQQRFNLDQEALRPYFPLDAVEQGMFTHAAKLFGVRFEPDNDTEKYHPEVRIYQVYGHDDTHLGEVHADYHPRDGKRAGAWMAEIRGRGYNRAGGIDLPIINIVGNFTKPVGAEPALLTFEEVETLFHEFGHGLHQLLSTVNYGSITGTNVLWDFVELPSQIMENWLGEAETLSLFARHYQNGEALPQVYIDAIRDSRNFMAGWFYMRQMSLGALDMGWHTGNPQGVGDVIETEKAFTGEFAVLPYEGGCVSTSFGHIFAGGYSAGYYSYAWAEVLDADAYEAFVEKGLYDAETGARFRDEILARGGAEHPEILYRNFRGRDADPQALLRKKGLKEAA